MKPIIGITCPQENGSGRHFLPRAYTDAIIMSGGLPLLLPAAKRINHKRVLEVIDGLLLAGGPDVDPLFFGEEPQPGLGEITPERDHFEVNLTKRALRKNIPILAICRGTQVLSIAAGGTVIQDISAGIAKPMKHSQDAPRWYATHTVELLKDTLLLGIIGAPAMRVNSFHHQAVGDVPADFSVSAKALDGVIEAIESTVHSFVIGVQWHPECMYATDKLTRQLFKAFIQASNTARNFR